MKKITISLLLSILLAGGYSGAAFADKHHNNGHARQEHRDNRFDNRNNKHNGNHNKGNHNKWNDSHKKHGNNHWNNNKRPNHPGMRPTPPPAPRPIPAPHHGYNIERDPRFHNMIAYAINGGTNYRVWRVNHDTYIVKYRKGRRWYTRRFYPYANRYDAPGLININWNPLQTWTLLPSVNINIPIF